MKKIAFDKNIHYEIIIFSHINKTKLEEKIFFKKYFSLLNKKTTEINENNLNQEIEKIKNKNIKYYKINNQDMKDLQRTFRTSKLKVYIENPINIGNGKILAQKNNYFTIYDNAKYEPLYKFESIKTNIISGILLDNNDLILNSNENIYIYRLEKRNYSLYQTIYEKKVYKPKYFQLGDIWEYHYLNFVLKRVKAMNENKFMSISTYGFKIYNKDENKNYLCIFTYICDGVGERKILENVHEIKNNEYILINKRKYKNYEQNFIRDEDEFVLEKLEIKNDENNEGIKKCGLNESDSGFFTKIGKFFKELISKDNNEKKELIIKYTIFEYLSNYIILKNKYFLILIENNLLILNLLNHQMKTYYITNGNIIKWNCPNDNKFLLIDFCDIILFELIDNNVNEDNILLVDLIITGYIKSNNIQNLIKFNNVQNRFYTKLNNFILLY